MRTLLYSAALLPLVIFGTTACGGGGGSSVVSPPPPILPPPPPPPPPPTNVAISGKITFDSVPFNTTTSGLNYAGITQRPARGIAVEVVDDTGAILGTDTTDASGDYDMTVLVSSVTPVRVRAKASMVQTAGAQWDVKTTDNTNGNALYAITGTATSTNGVATVRNLNAPSGWGGSGYTSARSAGPFAILDPIYDAMQKFSAVDPDIVFPPMEFRWSVNNRAADGDLASGEIGTSSYVTANGEMNVYLLGDDNSDTDEYDIHVVSHEWGHYFEDQLSRSDSTGGSHTTADRLDPRIAMGEGWGNAVSAIITDDPFYRDSGGAQQSQGFSVDVESNSYTNEGWFSEGSVQSILYDIYDSVNDDADIISEGLAPIYEAFIDSDYKDNPGFTSIFAYLKALRDNEPGLVTNLNALTIAQDINGTGQFGTGETNDGNITSALPVYKTVTVNGAAIEVCSVNDSGEFNKLGNRAFIRMDVPAAGAVTAVMTRTSGAANRDPDFAIYKNGAIVGTADSNPAASETFTGSLTAGAHVIEAYDFFNFGLNSNPTADSCYSFRVTQ